MQKSAFWVTVLLSANCLAAVGPLNLQHTIDLGGLHGRIDHLALDAKAHCLYVAALENNTVEVVDLDTYTRVSTLRDIEEPQGVAVIPTDGGVLIASGQDGVCRILDSSLRETGRITGLDDADNVRYDAANRLAYVGFGRGALAVIDPISVAKIVEIRLAGHPESFQLEKEGNRIFVNVPTARQIVVINRATRQIVAQWKIDAARSNFPMALDEKGHRLFVGCREPAKLLVVDTANGKTTASFDCCGDTDDVFWDAKRKRVYATGGEGSVTVLADLGGRLSVSSTIATARGARTSYFDADSGRLFVAVPNRDSSGARILVFAAEPN